MLKLWLKGESRSYKPPSWKTLSTLLKDSKHSVLAAKLDKHFTWTLSHILKTSRVHNPHITSLLSLCFFFTPLLSPIRWCFTNSVQLHELSHTVVVADTQAYYYYYIVVAIGAYSLVILEMSLPHKMDPCSKA